MKYADERPCLRSGDIVAFRDDNPLGWIIDHVTGGTYWHVGLVWVFRQRVFMLEADRQGVELRALSNALPCDWLATGIEWSDEVQDFALRRLGLPYDFAAAILAGIGLTPRQRHGEICSLYVAEILAAAGLVLDRRALTPSQVVTGLMDRGHSLARLTAI